MTSEEPHARKTRNFRKRKAEDTGQTALAGADDDNVDIQAIQDQIAERKTAQQQRLKLQGLRSEALALGLQKIEAAQAAGLSRRERNNLLNTYVKEQVERAGATDPNMEAWIREQMAKRLGQTLGEAEQMHPDDELYAIPRELQGQATKPMDPGAWATGIVEVALPMEFKMRNIEETEEAKKRILDSVRGEDNDEPVPAAPGVPRRMYARGFGKVTPLTAPSRPEDSWVRNKMQEDRRGKQRRGR